MGGGGSLLGLTNIFSFLFQGLERLTSFPADDDAPGKESSVMLYPWYINKVRYDVRDDLSVVSRGFSHRGCTVHYGKVRGVGGHWYHYK